jgi:hypothetical protein
MSNDKWMNSTPECEERMNHIGKRLTPCELMRQVYQNIKDPELRMKLRIATMQAKSMSFRITKYEGRGWGKAQWPLNPIYKGKKSYD